MVTSGRLNVPFYITTNLLPQFRHASSVLTRLRCFNTKTLPSKQPGVAAHLKKHAMEHLHWMALLINENIDIINKDELFYESGTAQELSYVDKIRKDEMALMRTGTMLEMTAGLNEVGSAEDLYQVSNDSDQLWIGSIYIGNGQAEWKIYQLRQSVYRLHITNQWNK